MTKWMVIGYIGMLLVLSPVIYEISHPDIYDGLATPWGPKAMLIGVLMIGAGAFGVLAAREQRDE